MDKLKGIEDFAKTRGAGAEKIVTINKWVFSFYLEISMNFSTSSVTSIIPVYSSL
jgi:hypothetical protein